MFLLLFLVSLATADAPLASSDTVAIETLPIPLDTGSAKYVRFIFLRPPGSPQVITWSWPVYYICKPGWQMRAMTLDVPPDHGWEWESVEIVIEPPRRPWWRKLLGIH